MWKKLLPEFLLISLKHYKYTGKFPNLLNPSTLNEKILWLKYRDRREWHKYYADKIKFKEIATKKIGKKYVVKTLGEFDSIEEAQEFLTKAKPPFIIKPNHDSGGGCIVRSLADAMDLDLSKLFAKRLSEDYFEHTREYQYKNIKPRLFAEELLVCEDGKLPNDYKIHMINGEPAFIYCSIDREGMNYRKIYSPDWRDIGMKWEKKSSRKSKFEGPDILPPQNLEEMICLAKVMADNFCYARIDFYDVDGRIYIGELTQHQSGGNDPIKPYELDLHFGKMLNLKKSPAQIEFEHDTATSRIFLI